MLVIILRKIKEFIRVFMKRFLSMFTIVIVIIIVYFSSVTNLQFQLKLNNINVIKFINQNDSEIIEIDNNSNIENIKKALNLEIYSKNNICDRIVYECYSNKLNNFVVIDGKKVNLQISITDNKIIIGYPLISTSF